MIRVACDGCLEDIDLSAGYIGMDEFVAPDDEDDESDELDDEDYMLHFHRTECVWAWACQRVAEVDFDG